MSLHDPDRLANLEQLNVDCFYTWRLPSELPPAGIKRIAMVWNLGLAERVLNEPAILDGYDIILLFNECDDTGGGQCIATPQQAAQMTLKLQAAFPNRLWGSPAVHNWGQSGWLDSYLQACNNCQIDFLAIHYYDWQPCRTNEFLDYVNSFKHYGKPIWLTEYGCLSPNPAYRLSYYREWYQLAKADDDILAIFPWTEGLPESWPDWWRWGIFVDNNNKLTELGQWYASEE